MPDGQLPNYSSPNDDLNLLCLGAGVLAGKVDIFPTYEAYFSINIKDFVRLQTDFGQLSLYKNAQDILQKGQQPSTDIRFLHQKIRNRHKKRNDSIIIENFLRALAVQGSGVFIREKNGISWYHPNKPIIAGLLGYPLAINSNYLLKEAFACSLDSSLGLKSGSLSPFLSTSTSPSQKKKSPSSPKHSESGKNTDIRSEPKGVPVRAKLMVCVPSALNCRARSDLLDSCCACGGQIRGVISSSVSIVAAFLSGTSSPTSTPCVSLTASPVSGKYENSGAAYRGTLRAMQESALSRLSAKEKSDADRMDHADASVIVLVVEVGKGHVSASVVEVENPDNFSQTDTDIHSGDIYGRRDMTVIRVLATCGTCLYGWSDADVQLTRSVASKEWLRICRKSISLATMCPAEITHMEWMKNIDEAFYQVEKLRAEGQSEGMQGGHKRVHLSSRAYVNDRGGSIWYELVKITVSTLATGLRSEPGTVEDAMEMAHCLQTIRRLMRVKLVEAFHQLLVENSLRYHTQTNKTCGRASGKNSVDDASVAPCGIISSSGEGIASGKSRRRSASSTTLVPTSDGISQSVHKTSLPPLGLNTKSASPSKRRSSWSSGMKEATSWSRSTAGGGARGCEERYSESDKEDAGGILDAAAVLELCRLDGDSDDDEDFVTRLDQLYVGVGAAPQKKRGVGLKTLPMGLQDVVNKCVEVRCSEVLPLNLIYDEQGAVKCARVCFTDSAYDIDGENARQTGKMGRSPSRKSPRKRKIRKKISPFFGDSTRRARCRGWQRSYRPAFSRKSSLEDGASMDILPSFSPVDGVLLYIEGRQLDDREINVSGKRIDEYVCSSVGIPGVRDAVTAAVNSAGIVCDVRVSTHPQSSGRSFRLEKSTDNIDRLEPLMYGTHSGPIIPRGLGRAMNSCSEGNLSSMTPANGSGVDCESSQSVSGLELVEMSAGCVWDGSCIVASALGVSVRVFEAPPTLGIRIVRQKIVQSGRAMNEDEIDPVQADKLWSSGSLSPFCHIQPVTEAEKALVAKQVFPRTSSWDKLKKSILSLRASASGKGGEQGAATIRTSFSTNDLSASKAGRLTGEMGTSSNSADDINQKYLGGGDISGRGSSDNLVAATSPGEMSASSGYNVESRVLWLMGNAPEGAALEGLTPEELAKEMAEEEEDEEEDDLFYDSHIERYHGRLTFDDSEEEEDEEEDDEDDSSLPYDEIRASVGTMESQDDMENDIVATVIARASGSGNDSVSFRGHRDKGVVYAPHTAWKGGYCNDVTALIRCSRFAHIAQQAEDGTPQKGEEWSGSWVDVWSAIPQCTEAHLSQDCSSVISEAQRRIDRAGDGKRGRVEEVTDLDSLIPLVRDKGDPTEGKYSSADNGRMLKQRHGDKTLSGDGDGAPGGGNGGKYRWVLQVVQLCDSPMQESRNVMIDEDGDADGLVVVCSIPLVDDEVIEKEECSYRVRIKSDDSTGLVSCALVPVILAHVKADTGEASSTLVSNGGGESGVGAHSSNMLTVGDHRFLWRNRIALFLFTQLLPMLTACAAMFIFLDRSLFYHSGVASPTSTSHVTSFQNQSNGTCTDVSDF